MGMFKFFIAVLVYSIYFLVTLTKSDRSSCGIRAWDLQAKNCPKMVCTFDFENHKNKVLSEETKKYYDSGSILEQTLNDNREAFRRHRLRPRMLRDVQNRSLCTSLLGTPVSIPVGIAPSAFHKMAHPDGELATAKAAQESGALMILSTFSTVSLEDVAAKYPHSPKWFQLYVTRNRSLTLNLVRRAEKAGYLALVVTVDGAFVGLRWTDERDEFRLPDGMEAANLQDLNFNTEGRGSALSNFFRAELDPTFTWKDINWLSTITDLPIVTKGILTGEDAKLAIEHGAAAIYVSNHGGRQLDSTQASIDALPDIVKAVNGSREVYMDGGVRVGTDVLKALALGAKAVFIGRPNLWGLSYNGSVGAKCTLDILRNELDNAMSLSGVATVGEVYPELVLRPRNYC